MDDKELFWLAGLLEGEGLFQKGAPCEPKYPQIKINMTDYDVITHVTNLFDVTYIQTSIPKYDHWKPNYGTLVKGKRAVRLMCQLYPLMGERRRQQIETAIGDKPAVLTEYAPTDENWFYWLAGLLEGEGSFQIQVKGEGRSDQPKLNLKMTDKDVVEHFALLLNTHVLGPYKLSGGPESANWKPAYDASVFGEIALEWMQRLRPYMGERRQAQIGTVIAGYHPKPRTYHYGESHHQAKLTADSVRTIKQRIRQGVKLTALAREYGVDTGLIWQIKAGRIWQQVPWPEDAEA
ncbi:MAG TPA: hypothetical protein VHO69_10035 [Phototrophicaceae bacterium]|nr:hypothetical protein [Phototrophicaceae bacterium]